MDQECITGDMSTEQISKLFHLRDSTDIECLATCREILFRHSWNVESAVQDQLNLKEGYPSVFAGIFRTSSVSRKVDQNIRQIYKLENLKSVKSSSRVLNIPKKFYNLIVSVVKYTWRLVYPESRRLINNPTIDIERFIRNYESKYGVVHPVYYRGSYRQALYDAKQELRFLVIYLHKNGESDCSKFCSTVLPNNEVISFISEHNILFWACDKDTHEGKRVASAFQANIYPYVAIIMTREHRMEIVERMKGFMSASEFLNKLQTVFEDNKDYLTSALAIRIEHSFNEQARQASIIKSFNANKYKEPLEVPLSTIGPEVDWELDKVVQQVKEMVVDPDIEEILNNTQNLK